MTHPAAVAFPLAAQLALAAPGADAWQRSQIGGIRGITVGPIENGYHPGLGYGSPAYGRTLQEAAAMGANWIAITPFGRAAGVAGEGVDWTFEAPFERNRRDVERAIDMAHANGLRVFLVPQLWLESPGAWRGEIEEGSDANWARWSESYGRFIRAWASVAEARRAEMFSVGVEFRSWVTTPRAPSFATIVADVRRVYHGLLTYSANWDDVERTVILGQLDVIGINGFYPLSETPGASEAALSAGGQTVRRKVHALAQAWQKPVVFTETGYTTRPDPAFRPWEWPEAFHSVATDEAAQEVAYRALLGPMLDEPDFAGFFVWRVYADPDDVSQEPPWGFSPRGKRAEIVVRDAFAARWASDPWWRRAWGDEAHTPGIYP